jgi:hypothetical protein
MRTRPGRIRSHQEPSFLKSHRLLKTEPTTPAAHANHLTPELSKSEFAFIRCCFNSLPISCHVQTQSAGECDEQWMQRIKTTANRDELNPRIEFAY